MTHEPGGPAVAYDAHAQAAWWAAAGLLRDAGAADAVVRDAFLEVFRPAAPGDVADVEAVARGLAIAQLRGQGVLDTVAGDIPDDARLSATMAAGDLVWSDPTATAPGATSVADAAASLGGLGADDRVLLALRYAQGRSVPEVAALVGRSEGAAAVALHRARGRFTAAYAERTLARRGLPDGCRAFRDQVIAHAAMRPVSEAYAVHRTGCGWCRESEQCLRDRAVACAAAPLVGLPSGPSPALRSDVLAAVPAAAAPALAPPAPASPAPAMPSVASPAPASGGRRPALVAAAVAIGAVVVAVVGGVWLVAGPGAAPEPTPSPVAVATPTPAPTRVAPAGFVAVDVAACGTVATTGALDAGGSVVGSADVKADAMAGIDPAGYVLFAVAPPGGGAGGGPHLELAPRYWTCVSVADQAAGIARVSLMPTMPVLLEKLALAPIVAMEPGGAFTCGAPVDAGACRAARAIHEDQSLATMR